MGLQYRIAEKTYNQLLEWYLKLGYNSEEAKALSGFVFSHTIEADQDVPSPSGWEIEFSAPSICTGVKKQKERIYAHWMKGGWNRIGAWETVLEKHEEKPVSPVQLPGSGWNTATGMSVDYLHYMQECKRSVDTDGLDPQDALYGIHTVNSVALSQLPLSIEAFADENYLCVCVDVTAKLAPAMHHVFAVDVSGSMRSRWVLVQLSMAALFRTLPSGAEVSVIAFADCCQMIRTDIAAGDLSSFMQALRQIPANGGFSASVPVLQTAFGVLHRTEHTGIVTLFTDDSLLSGFASQEICNDYLREEAAFGNRLHLVCYGTDSWRSAELRQMGWVGGRMRTVLSPSQLPSLLEEHWEIPANTIRNFRVYPVGGTLKLLGGNTDQWGSLAAFPLSPGCSSTAAFLNWQQSAPGETLSLYAEWETESGATFKEQIAVPIRPMTKMIQAALQEATAVQMLKEKQKGESE